MLGVFQIRALANSAKRAYKNTGIKPFEMYDVDGPNSIPEVLMRLCDEIEEEHALELEKIRLQNRR